MANEQQSIHGVWASRWVFILAATGSAVGLGNIWKFPYMAGVYGGGAFVAVYLVCIALIGAPIMLAETVLGRRGRQSPVNSLRSLAQASNASPRWAWAAMIGMIAALMILSFYSVVAGWALDYILGMGRGAFAGISGQGAAARFSSLTDDPWRLAGWHSLFMLITALIIARGVVAGLEKALRIMMPMLFVLLVVLFGYSLSTGHFMEGVRFLFHFDLAEVPAGILAAMGHAFFTLSVGVGSIMVFGAYMPRHASIGRTVITVALLDTLVALTAGMALFPVVFAAGLEPSAGPGLMFVTLPIAFGNIALGEVFGLLFFLLVAIAAWSSAISMLEPAVAYGVERSGWSRPSVTAVIAALCWLVGMGTVLSFNVLADARFMVTDDTGWHWFAWTDSGGRTFFESIDYLTSRILLPLGGLSFCLFGGWVLSRDALREELSLKHPWLFPMILCLLRYVAPAGVIVVFVTELFK
ncbi:neurotransmitter:Na+ symporter, NSS family [Halopseudomonas xinjiangensis]|uniref:Transporter n=1 Tax=Halopseudomonas xinjiangensis TaxID=487184 RepID=A0A1H1WDZ9_9GAMM|nr:sodium-dependent transporter [Halopseudomonas xinjiangensis]SDS94586.1 neurotransmitter:Na+ symporter, NSS family [Halopseudomonas xinjiangensis]